MKRPKDRLQRVVVIGATPAGIAATNKLGELGIAVTLVDSEANLDRKLARQEWRLASGIPFNFAHRPGLIRILRNRRIKCMLPARVDGIKHNHQGFSVHLTCPPTFVDPEKCVLCGRCAEICPVAGEVSQRAIQFDGRFALPGRVVIDKRRDALCRAGCPLGVNVQGYVALAKEGRYPEALALIRENNILPGICGRICTHPCEAQCRRGEVDEAVAIRAIKRFLADFGAGHPEQVAPPRAAARRKEHCAVIGSGPAGLAAAAQLARAGCRVTVFEKEAEAGGLLRYGIGPHRLPRHILDAELDAIRALGVTFALCRPIDGTAEMAALQAQFDAVLIASGAWRDRVLGVKGEDLKGVEGCLSFLNRLHRREISVLAGKAAVIGDGNAAFDLARTLVRLGAEVTLLSWFARGDIPADAAEVTTAQEEGVTIVCSTRVTAFEGRKGSLRRLLCRPTQPGPADDSGIAWPVLAPGGKPLALAFDLAFVAIGQRAAAPLAGGITTDSRGFIRVDDRFSTNLQRVYAAGDAVSGPSTVVQAMARGKAAADQVLRAICGFSAPPMLSPIPLRPDFPEIPSDTPVRQRVAEPQRPARERRSSFAEVALGMSAPEVHREAQRCLQCGVCAECMQCAEVCGAIGAIRHQESEQHLIEQAGVVIIADSRMAAPIRGEDVIRAHGPASSRTDVAAMMMRGFAAAAQAMVLLGSPPLMPKGHGVAFHQPEPVLEDLHRIGVFVCQCNRSLGWREEMDRFLEELKQEADVVHSEALLSACSAEGSAEIVKTVRDKGITRIVLGSCVCCALDFVCSACTDQRSRLKHNLFTATGIGRSMVVTRNIRGEALSLLSREPRQALLKFEGLLKRSLKSTRHLKPFSTPARNTNFATAVIGESEAALTSAATLARIGMDVFLFSDKAARLPELMAQANVHCFGDAVLERLGGTLGDFTIEINSGALRHSIHVGAVIMGEKSRRRIGYAHQEGLPLRRIAGEMQRPGAVGIPFFHPGMTSVPGLFLADPPGLAISSKQKGQAAAALAAAVMPRGPRKNKGYTVTIDPQRCRYCGRCVEVCPYQAVTLHPNGRGGWHAAVDEAFCKGCGNCISVCPSNAADSPYRSQLFFERTLEEILLPSPSGDGSARETSSAG